MAKFTVVDVEAPETVHIEVGTLKEAIPYTKDHPERGILAGMLEDGHRVKRFVPIHNQVWRQQQGLPV